MKNYFLKKMKKVQFVYLKISLPILFHTYYFLNENLSIQVIIVIGIVNTLKVNGSVYIASLTVYTIYTV